MYIMYSNMYILLYIIYNIVLLPPNPQCAAPKALATTDLFTISMVCLSLNIK